MPTSKRDAAQFAAKFICFPNASDPREPATAANDCGESDSESESESESERSEERNIRRRAATL